MGAICSSVLGSNEVVLETIWRIFQYIGMVLCKIDGVVVVIVVVCGFHSVWGNDVAFSQIVGWC